MKISVLALAAAALGFSRLAAFEDAPTVKVADASQPGGYVVRDKATYDPALHGPLFEAPAPAAAPPTPPAAPAATPVPPLGGDPATTPPAAPPVAGYADPAFRPRYVAQIGTRWFLTDDKGQKFQKGQSAAGYDTQEAAQTQAQKLATEEATPA